MSPRRDRQIRFPQRRIPGSDGTNRRFTFGSLMAPPRHESSLYWSPSCLAVTGIVSARTCGYDAVKPSAQGAFMDTWVHITSGQGPDECCWVVAQLLDA